MTKRFRIDGIYDLRTIRSCKNLGIFDFCFDFRPTSLNFLQLHIFLDLVKKHIGDNDNVFLRFHKEQPYIIKKFINDLSNIGISKDRIFLEFTEEMEPNILEEFGVAYLLYYYKELELSIFDLKSLHGVIIKANDLIEFKNNGKINSFHQNLFRWLGVKSIDTQLYLLQDWDSDLYSSIIELFDFDTVALPINSKIEVCYRNVNDKMFLDNFKLLKLQHS